jgi:hypothetical protein
MRIDVKSLEKKTNLFLEQWQRPEEEPHLRAASSMELHFLLREEEDKGGLPAEGWVK